MLLVHVDSGHSLTIVVPRLASYRVDAFVRPPVLSSRAWISIRRFHVATGEELGHVGLFRQCRQRGAAVICSRARCPSLSFIAERRGAMPASNAARLPEATGA